MRDTRDEIMLQKIKNTTWKIQHFIDEKDNSRKITISVQLIRSITSILLVTFLPTFLMNIINLATIHIEVDSKYEVIIMVNITSLVVLASIYVSVSSSLKSTPEIKPVEIWLLSNLVLPFMVIIETILLQVQFSLYCCCAQCSCHTLRPMILKKC